MEKKDSNNEQGVILSQKEDEVAMFSPNWENTQGFLPKTEDDRCLQERGA